MQTPLQITAHDLILSEAVETDIREKAAKLERYYQRLISCRVAAECRKNRTTLCVVD